MTTSDFAESSGSYPFQAAPPVATGGLIITLHEGAEREGLLALREAVGRGDVANSRDFSDNLKASAGDFDGAPAVVFDRLKVAVVHPGDQQEATSIRDRLLASEAVQEARPEFYMYALEQTEGFVDSVAATWGVQAVGAAAAAGRGEGIKIAVLDTGLDLRHPDFAGRKIVTRTEVPGQAVQDGQGHGTHCIGTAAGGLSADGVRYGVASGADIYAVKVLSDSGSGKEGWILAGME